MGNEIENLSVTITKHGEQLNMLATATDSPVSRMVFKDTFGIYGIENGTVQSRLITESPFVLLEYQCKLLNYVCI